MISIGKENLKTYQSSEEKVLFYSDMFSGKIVEYVKENINKKTLSSLTAGISLLTGKNYIPRKTVYQSGGIACVCLNTEKILFENEKEQFYIECFPGSLLIIGDKFREKWNFSLPKLSIKLYEENYLPTIYLSIEKRLEFAERINEKIGEYKKLPHYKQCIQNDLKLELLGKGCYGNVFRTGYKFGEFALKLSKIKAEEEKYIYDKNYSSWTEVYILKELIKPLITNNICPNFPLLYDHFTCSDCVLNIKDEKVKCSCVILALELAETNLKQWLSVKRTHEELESCLFQIMAALHAIQYHSQIMNFDVKKENIICYKVEKGGVWNYKIKGKDYYVPNLGYLFVLNDYGLSRSMSPNHQIYKKDYTFRLGSRYAVIKDGEFKPFSVVSKEGKKISWLEGKKSKSLDFTMSKEGEFPNYKLKFTPEIKNFLRSKNIPITVCKEFFLFPEIIPPFEFYNDTQDVIRMFVGGKRTTQKKNHSVVKNLPKKFTEKLEKYRGKGENTWERFFSTNPEQLMAGYFIQSFFPHFLKLNDQKIIASYNISI